jgi:KTSC domain
VSWNKPVYSSMVSEVGWDSETNELLVKWAKSGKISAYAGFDEAKAIELSNAPSVGQMVITEIKNSGNPHRYV